MSTETLSVYKTNTTKNFHAAIAAVLGEVLKKHISNDENGTQKLTTLKCVQIYTEIFEQIKDIFVEANVELTNESMNYIAQCYYDGILINNTQELDPNIFSQRADLKKIETRELALLTMILAGTDFRIPVVAEIKHRS